MYIVFCAKRPFQLVTARSRNALLMLKRIKISAPNSLKSVHYILWNRVCINVLKSVKVLFLEQEGTKGSTLFLFFLFFLFVSRLFSVCVMRADVLSSKPRWRRGLMGKKIFREILKRTSTLLLGLLRGLSYRINYCGPSKGY